MSSFVFNGVNSDSLGLIVTKPMIRPAWSQEVAYTAIPGRARISSYTQPWYNNSELTVSAVIADASPQKVRNIYAALRGSGTLVISASPQERISVAEVRLPVPEAKALLVAELPITFICEPFAESTSETTVDLTNKLVPFGVTNAGTVYADPEITIIPSAARTDINCNGKVIFVTTPTEIVNANYPANAKVVLDCEGQLAYYQIGTGSKISCTQNTQGPFPRLNVGENLFLSTASQSISMKYRERWL